MVNVNRSKIVGVVLLATLAIPVFAQRDPAGEWAPRFHEDAPERGPGPEIGDYLGLPITDAARLRADSWDASLLTLPEHQCKPHPADYGPRGPANLLQGLRDYFGAHTYRRLDKPGVFHTRWGQDGEEVATVDQRPALAAE